MERPLIGISCALSSELAPDLSKHPLYHVYAWYAEAIWRAGGWPVLVPPLISSDEIGQARELLNRLDGLYLSGGGLSTAPKREIQPKLCETQPIRSAAEFALVRAAKGLKLPLLGSCRGHQIICEALGGTIAEDILQQHNQIISYYYPSHEIEVLEGTRLAELIGSGFWPVNSMHCQYVETCPPGFRVNAIGPEGITEGMESDDPDWFCLTFQYHPEVMIFDEKALKVMRHFINIARSQKGGSTTA